MKIKEFFGKKFFLSLFIFWQLIFLFFPLFLLIFKGINNKNFFNDLFWVFKSNYLIIILKTFFLAFFTSTICLFIGYTVSLIIASKKEFFRNFFLFLMAIPFLTNFIIHVISWSCLLQKNGLVFNLFKYFKFFKNDFFLLNTNFATYVGYVYCFMPFMIFPLYNSLSKFDKKFFEASYDLGASYFRTLFRVVIPITKQAIYTGFFLVLVSASGEFMIPEILGGDKNIYCGSVFSNVLLSASLVEKGSLIGILFIIFLLIFCILSFLFIRFIMKFLEKI